MLYVCTSVNFVVFVIKHFFIKINTGVHTHIKCKIRQLGMLPVHFLPCHYIYQLYSYYVYCVYSLTESFSHCLVCTHTHKIQSHLKIIPSPPAPLVSVSWATRHWMGHRESWSQRHIFTHEHVHTKLRVVPPNQFLPFSNASLGPSARVVDLPFDLPFEFFTSYFFLLLICC